MRELLAARHGIQRIDRAAGENGNRCRELRSVEVCSGLSISDLSSTTGSRAIQLGGERHVSVGKYAELSGNRSVRGELRKGPIFGPPSGAIMMLLAETSLLFAAGMRCDLVSTMG
jgi:hypothetical protein